MMWNSVVLVYVITSIERTVQEYLPIVHLHDFAPHQDLIDGFNSAVCVLERALSHGSELTGEEGLHGNEHKHTGQPSQCSHTDLNSRDTSYHGECLLTKRRSRRKEECSHSLDCTAIW